MWKSIRVIPLINGGKRQTLTMVSNHLRLFMVIICYYMLLHVLAFHFTMILWCFFVTVTVTVTVSSTVVFSPETTDLGVTGDSAGRQLLQWLEEQDPSIRWELVLATRPHEISTPFFVAAWWLIPLKWLISPIISGLSLLIPFITGVISHLLSEMSHQVVIYI